MRYKNYDKVQGFNKKLFEKEQFGVNGHRFFDWRDVKNYFGGYSLEVLERDLRQGVISGRLFNDLSRVLGEETMERYIPKEEPKKVSEEDKEIEDLASLLGGSVNEVNEVMSRKNYQGFRSDKLEPDRKPRRKGYYAP